MKMDAWLWSLAHLMLTWFFSSQLNLFHTKSKCNKLSPTQITPIARESGRYTQSWNICVECSTFTGLNILFDLNHRLSVILNEKFFNFEIISFKIVGSKLTNNRYFGLNGIILPIKVQHSTYFTKNGASQSASRLLNFQNLFGVFTCSNANRLLTGNRTFESEFFDRYKLLKLHSLIYKSYVCILPLSSVILLKSTWEYFVIVYRGNEKNWM